MASNPSSWYCQQCPDRVFTSEKALFQHYRPALEKHLDSTKHNPTTPTSDYNCSTCSRKYSSQFSLQEHYRQSPNHPQCIPCRKGFKNKKQYDQHLSEEHSSTVACSQCKGRQIRVDELQTHFRHSPNHPKCVKCNEGFDTDKNYEQHVEDVHIDSRCFKCRRIFDDPEELIDHYITSSSHPICELCNTGFADNSAYQDHLALEHSALSPSPTHDSTEVSKLHTSAPARLANGLTSSIWSSPVDTSPKSLGWSPNHASPVESGCRFNPFETQSGLGFDSVTMVNDLVEDTILRTVLEPVPEEPPVDSAQPAARSDNQRPKHFSKSLLHPLNTSIWKNLPFPPSETSSCSPDTSSPVGLAALPDISPLASTPTDITLINGVASPSSPVVSIPARRSPTSAPALIYTTVRGGSPSPPSSSIHAGERPAELDDYPSSRSSTLSCSSPDLSNYTFGNDMLSMESPLPFSPLESGIPTSAMSTINALQRKTLGDRLHRGYTPVSVRRKVTTPSLSVHCRQCGKDSCDDPTATMCGHLFCYRCITEQVIRTSRCPVCATPNLLYCIFRLHLSQ
ncbi:myc-associated zinc finger [Moniliophthora roreri MCA 2997]|uniref:Myc-associated zinc finger n=1 Tax=Moniliophthora roreri (strain MCA 2997) TaxID=1381753 RepID=V2XRE6_MONRO|nr:myc-associated zinc finger [Moniliophthora roreri MCA 2997]